MLLFEHSECVEMLRCCTGTTKRFQARKNYPRSAYVVGVRMVAEDGDDYTLLAKLSAVVGAPIKKEWNNKANKYTFYIELTRPNGQRLAVLPN